MEASKMPTWLLPLASLGPNLHEASELAAVLEEVSPHIQVDGRHPGLSQAASRNPSSTPSALSPHYHLRNKQGQGSRSIHDRSVKRLSYVHSIITHADIWLPCIVNSLSLCCSQPPFVRLRLATPISIHNVDWTRLTAVVSTDTLANTQVPLSRISTNGSGIDNLPSPQVSHFPLILEACGSSWRPVGPSPLILEACGSFSFPSCPSRTWRLACHSPPAPRSPSPSLFFYAPVPGPFIIN